MKKLKDMTEEDFDEALGITEEVEYGEDGYEICSACNGSGEGMYDGSTCYKCHGSGEEPYDKQDDIGDCYDLDD